jgi:prepilin-type processing-associated H-X9-DG protein
MPLAGMEMQRLFPGLFASLGLDKLEFAALSAQWSQGASSVDVTIATAQGNEAFLDFLAARNAPLEIASLVPDDYAFFVRGSMTSAADAVNRLNGILGVIDPEIVAEFQQECAEFRTDVGFDPLQDLLGNLVEEWIVAAKFDANGKPVGIAAVRMGDPAKFQRHAENLIRAFNLKVESQPCGDTVIYSAPAETGIHLAWATLGNHLLLSDCAASIVDIVKRPALAPDVAVAHAWTGIMPHFAAETARFAFVNIAPLARLAVEEVRNEPEAAEFLPILQQLAESSAGIGLAVTRGDASVNIRIAANEAVNRSVRDLAWKSVAVSTNRARMLARRTVSAANIRNIIYGCMIYANDHKNAWPDNFAVLWQAGAVAPQSFVAPHDMCLAVSAENVDEVSSYLYRPGTKLQASEVVVCERQLQESGANFGFADGHVEWISGPRAEELLADMQRTAAR